jgi:1-acyl-sn-glycerol-3-phosphate acyltransferase
LYYLIKSWVRAGLLFYCNKVVINNRNILNERGPLLLACNHPNSFFDAVLLGALFKNPVHFLARGDAFKNPIAKKILTALNAIPIYRLSEGKEYLALNDAIFERCNQILKDKGIVLIFSEGLCVNQWELRPLKKGSARIAINAWNQEVIAKTFRVLPVSLNYNSFTIFWKKIIIEFGEPIVRSETCIAANEAGQIRHFNKLLYSRLKKGILTDNNISIVQFLLSNTALVKDLSKPVSYLKTVKAKLTSDSLKKELPNFFNSKRIALNTTSFVNNLSLSVLLFIPALTGVLIHLPVYLPLKKFIKNKTEGTVFYDSTLFAALLIIYPFYVLLLTVLCSILISPLCLLLIIAFPFFALIYLYWKDCFVSVINYFKMQKNERKAVQDLFR